MGDAKKEEKLKIQGPANNKVSERNAKLNF